MLLRYALIRYATTKAPEGAIRMKHVDCTCGRISTGFGHAIDHDTNGAVPYLWHAQCLQLGTWNAIEATHELLSPPCIANCHFIGGGDCQWVWSRFPCGGGGFGRSHLPKPARERGGWTGFWNGMVPLVLDTAPPPNRMRIFVAICRHL